MSKKFGMDVNNLYGEEPAAEETKKVELKRGYQITPQRLTKTVSFLTKPDTLADLDKLKKQLRYESRNKLINDIIEEYIERNLYK